MLVHQGTAPAPTGRCAAVLQWCGGAAAVRRRAHGPRRRRQSSARYSKLDSWGEGARSRWWATATELASGFRMCITIDSMQAWWPRATEGEDDTGVRCCGRVGSPPPVRASHRVGGARLCARHGGARVVLVLHAEQVAEVAPQREVGALLGRRERRAEHQLHAHKNVICDDTRGPMKSRRRTEREDRLA
eukprot:SAG11_NODE_396_length_9806_cov_37.601855_3_plen_189_part_00